MPEKYTTNYQFFAEKRYGNRECLKWIKRGVIAGLPVGLLIGILTDPEIGLYAGLALSGAHVLKGLCCIEDSRRRKL